MGKRKTRLSHNSQSLLDSKTQTAGTFQEKGSSLLLIVKLLFDDCWTLAILKNSYFKCAVKNIVEIQNNAFNSAVKKLQVPNMEKVDVIIIRQPHGKRFYLVVSFKTHMHARTHTHEPLETITMSAFNPRLQRKIPGNLRH